MERNTETLSTRDLASPNEQVGGTTTSEGDVRDAATPEGQPEVYDQASPAAERTRLPVDEHIAPPDEARMETSGRDQSVEAARPMPASTETGAPGRADEDRPAESASRSDAGSGHRDGAPIDGRDGLGVERRVVASGRDGRHVPTAVEGDPDPVRR